MILVQRQGERIRNGHFSLCAIAWRSRCTFVSAPQAGKSIQGKTNKGVISRNDPRRRRRIDGVRRGADGSTRGDG